MTLKTCEVVSTREGGPGQSTIAAFLAAQGSNRGISKKFLVMFIDSTLLIQLTVKKLIKLIKPIQ